MYALVIRTPVIAQITFSNTSVINCVGKRPMKNWLMKPMTRRMMTSKLIWMMGHRIDKRGIVGVDGYVCGGRSA